MKTLPDLDSLDVQQLAALVTHHNHRYWDLDDPEISDYDYDRLVNKLKQVAPNHPVHNAMGPTAARQGAEVRHKQAMLSLDKCYSDEDLDKWGVTFTGNAVMMPKFDGIACSLHYNAHGNLVMGATRGDGVTGDDITLNVREIAEIPKKIKTDRAVEVRGEVYMKISVFQKFKAEGMANPRNAAAGAIKQKDPKKSGAAGLSFAAYDLVGTDHKSHEDELNALVSYGFAPIDHELLPKDQFRAGYQRMAQKRPTLDYEIDGVVFKTDSIAEQDRLGATAHHPRYAIAYKFQGDSGTSVLRGVEWSVGRMGAITPVAIVDPVSLSGVTVTRASLHHPKFIEKLKLTLGAEVVMMRRGGVIPNVEFVSKPGTVEIDLPAKCPVCGSGVRWEKDFLFCNNAKGCKAIVIGMLSHYAEHTGMLGFGDSILESAYDANILRTPADFYTLTADVLAAKTRCGDKIAAKLIKEVDKRRTLDLATFLRALGLAELGKNVSGILTEKYGTLDKVLAVTVEEFSQVKGIGETISKTVVQGLKDNEDLIQALCKHVKFEAVTAPQKPVGAAGGAFAGQTFVFTGKMNTMERKDAEDLVANYGGSSLDAVNKALTWLVIGDDKKAGAKSSKEKAADKLVAAGAPLKIISETDFLAMVEAAKGAAGGGAATPVAAPSAPDPAPATVSVASAPAAASEGPLFALVSPTPKAAPAAPSAAAAKLAGKVFVFAATMVSVKEAAAAQRVVALGATVQDMVDANTTHLVVGTRGKAGEKLTSARRIQLQGGAIEILDEAQFGAMIA